MLPSNPEEAPEGPHCSQATPQRPLKAPKSLSKHVQEIPKKRARTVQGPFWSHSGTIFCYLGFNSIHFINIHQNHHYHNNHCSKGNRNIKPYSTKTISIVTDIELNNNIDNY